MEINKDYKDYKICAKQNSEKCFKLAQINNFRAKSRECKECYKKRMTEYYSSHKEVMKQQSKIANIKRYVPKPRRVKTKPIDAVLEENNKI